MKRHLCLGILWLVLMPLWGVADLPYSPAALTLGKPAISTSKADSLLRVFELTPHPEGTRLHWEAPYLQGAVYFFVERSTNGQDFELIGGVPADTLHEWSDYQLSDRLRTFGKVHSFDYRIEIWFQDGSTLVTAPQRVYPYESERLTVFPDQASGHPRVRFEGEVSLHQVYSLEVYNLQGNLVQEMQISADQLEGNQPLPLPVQPGNIYFFRLQDGRQTWFGRSRL